MLLSYSCNPRIYGPQNTWTLLSYSFSFLTFSNSFSLFCSTDITTFSPTFLFGESEGEGGRERGKLRISFLLSFISLFSFPLVLVLSFLAFTSLGVLLLGFLSELAASSSPPKSHAVVWKCFYHKLCLPSFIIWFISLVHFASFLDSAASAPAPLPLPLLLRT